MAAAPHETTGLAYEVDGTGAPVVFLHGLTFDRRSWRPIIERLGDSVRSIAVDLPAHGESGGVPAPFDQVAAQVHELLGALAVERPIVVGHSMSGGLACVYAARYPTRGVVVIDNGPDVRPFAELLHRLERVLRGPGFANAWQTFEKSLGLERIPDPERSLVLATHRVEQEVVVGYWEELLRVDPVDSQSAIDGLLPRLDRPCLAVFGRPVTDGERERFSRLPDVQLEEWAGDGHFVHLVDPDRFTTRLRQFVDHCVASDQGTDQRADLDPRRPPSGGPERPAWCPHHAMCRSREAVSLVAEDPTRLRLRGPIRGSWVLGPADDN
jgi:pimeloyl-ACP methyl ester carboxylesterase